MTLKISQLVQNKLTSVQKNYIEEIIPAEDNSTSQTQSSDLPEELSSTFEERLNILNDALEDIDSEIGLRLKITKSFKDALQGERKWLGFKLSQFDRWHWGDKPSVDFRRTALERELLAIYREMRTQTQRAFTDIAGLKKERRKLEMEFKALKATQRAVSEE